MRPILFENARIVDPSQNMDETGSLLIEGTKILDCGAVIRNQGFPEKTERIDCTGKLIIPGIVDASVFLHKTSQGYSHALEKISSCAACAGVTSLIIEPKCEPILDNPIAVQSLLSAAKEKASVHVYIHGAMTKELSGTIPVEFSFLKQAGAISFSQGDHSITNALIMRTLLLHAFDHDALIVHHPQDKDLAAQGSMNEGLHAYRLGLPGIPFEAELIMLERDLILARSTGARYHASKISSAFCVDSLQRAKNDGLQVSSSVSIHNLCFNENDIGEYNSAFKLFPPLREEKDRIALIEGLKQGTLDTLVSSHKVKKKGLAPFTEVDTGSIALETFLAAALRLYHTNHISLIRLIDMLSTKPAKLFKLPAGSLKANSLADFVLVDLNAPWIFKSNPGAPSQASACFENAHFSGKVLQTWVAGKKIFDNTSSPALF